jgi:predicted nucleic acid-binding protein
VNYLKRNTQNFPRIVIDTTTLFSAIYNRKGNEAHLLELADSGKCEIIIFDYIKEEIETVFQRKELDIELVNDLLDNYHNITISSLEDITEEEIFIAFEVIDDPKDRPIFIFAKRIIDSIDFSYFITGDKGFFKEKVTEILPKRIIHTIDAIDLINKNDDRLDNHLKPQGPQEAENEKYLEVRCKKEEDDN